MRKAPLSSGASPYGFDGIETTATMGRETLLICMDQIPDNTANRNAKNTPITFEIFIQNSFSDLEVAAVTSVLDMANRILERKQFHWEFVSDTPGLVEGRCGMIARAQPLIWDQNLKTFLVVTGGNGIKLDAWLPRVRAMRRQSAPVVLLSDAATAFIREWRSTNAAVATHWYDVWILEETGSYPNLTRRYAAVSEGIVTSAGLNYTPELIITLIANLISPSEYMEICNRLLVQSIRDSRSEQPKGIGYLMSAFGSKVSGAIEIMEANIEEPILPKDIANRVNVSLRQLERLFVKNVGIPPARYYRSLRVRKAHALAMETDMTLLNVALATGFSSVASLAAAYRNEFRKSLQKTRKSTGLKIR
ncbi:transcriptional regulator, AraC family [Epibacterium ulvae]|uniref:Transcriptional regulator, AraC family n=1 Tax=Epibacterium ulvae TaxID=1156985 RepID=A0A1G5QV27_9RHOB|nr:helix-turn-helix domain-containing protein [Epibacterium ulvae]SCZ65582.1 transcriptional regulator, AraC family [Epibacterium ulvae]